MDTKNSKVKKKKGLLVEMWSISLTGENKSRVNLKWDTKKE